MMQYFSRYLVSIAKKIKIKNLSNKGENVFQRAAEKWQKLNKQQNSFL